MTDVTSSVTETNDVCALPLVRRLGAMLDIDPKRWSDGDALPRGWHVIMFTVDTPQSGLRHDGMAGTGVPLPGVDLPRVVMGGRRLEFDGDIPIGASVRRLSRVAAVEPKSGRSGRLVIVTMRNEIFVADRRAASIVEEQDYVFREAASEQSAPAPRSQPPSPDERPVADVVREFTPDETFLFRYCAVTFNPHRIHYDQPYTLEQEHFPALVVNGGITALLVTELFRSEAGREPASITTRNIAPLFCNEVIRLNGLRGEPAWRLWAEDAAGRRALEGVIE